MVTQTNKVSPQVPATVFSGNSLESNYLWAQTPLSLVHLNPVGCHFQIWHFGVVGIGVCTVPVPLQAQGNHLNGRWTGRSRPVQDRHDTSITAVETVGRASPTFSGWQFHLLCRNLANVDVMGHITKIAAVENATAIWEYDPDLYDNRVLGGSLDVITAVHTITIKVSFFFISSPSRWIIPS